MIKFFRKIRQRLLVENKFTKYLLYALGEIALVMIGILLALQVNNWNEQRKMKAEEQELLANLKLSFEQKLLELEDKMEGRQKNVKGIDRLLETIAQPEPSITEDDPFTLLQQLFSWYAVNEEFSSIQTLFSTGKINLITNDALRLQLIAWPDRMEEMLEEQRVIQDLVIHQLNPLISTYVSSSNLANSYFENNIDLKRIPSPYPNDWNGLLTDRKFESLIAQKKIYLIANIIDTQPLIDQAKTILELIESDLNPYAGRSPNSNLLP
ncbi:DUF6090 family protein [Croceiramulus getboli]|nr:DUF6090 family protein [Flavobacteriaceae bacterium YJPT1-3]